MGCDIQVYVEYKHSTSEIWDTFGGPVRPARIYDLFAILAGVRNEANVIPIAADRGIPDLSELEQKYRSDDDYHSPSWCTVEELEQAIIDAWDTDCAIDDIEWKALIELGRFFQRRTRDVRFVFWFY